MIIGLVDCWWYNRSFLSLRYKKITVTKTIVKLLGHKCIRVVYSIGKMLERKIWLFYLVIQIKFFINRRFLSHLTRSLSVVKGNCFFTSRHQMYRFNCFRFRSNRKFEMNLLIFKYFYCTTFNTYQNVYIFVQS